MVDMAKTNLTSSTLTPIVSNGASKPISDWLEELGGFIIDMLDSTGDFLLFVWSTWTWLFTRWPRRETIWTNLYQVGVMSLPVVALTGTFIGMVLAVQSYGQFRQLGLQTRLGAVINMSLVRELGPVLAATMLAGRVGSAMSAELGTMRVTEQIDALDSMGANPIHYLVVPRFMACIFMIPTLTIMADYMGVVGGYFYSVIDAWESTGTITCITRNKFVGVYTIFSAVSLQKRLLRWNHRLSGVLSRVSIARPGPKGLVRRRRRRLFTRSCSSCCST